MGTKRGGVMLFIGIAVVLGTLAAAWACTGQPQVFSVNPITAPVGAQVTMRGEAVAVGAPVELRWNGVAGPKLAEVTADSRAGFEMVFTVPEVAPGVYSLVVVTRDGAAAVGRTAFEVSGAGTVTADSGFASATQAAGLDAAVPVGSSAALLAGVGLLAAGGVALFAGFAVATVRRRRAPARTST